MRSGHDSFLPNDHDHQPPHGRVARPVDSYGREVPWHFLAAIIDQISNLDATCSIPFHSVLLFTRPSRYLPLQPETENGEHQSWQTVLDRSLLYMCFFLFLQI